MADQGKDDVPLHTPEPYASGGNAGQPTSPPPVILNLPQHYQQYVQPVHYMMQGAPMPGTAYQRSPHPPPHSFLVLALLSLIICALLNFTSLAIGIPALVFSVSSIHAVQKNQWKAANNYGKLTFYLSIANWSYVLGGAFLATGITMGLWSRTLAYYYYYY